VFLPHRTHRFLSLYVETTHTKNCYNSPSRESVHIHHIPSNLFLFASISSLISYYNEDNRHDFYCFAYLCLGLRAQNQCRLSTCCDSCLFSCYKCFDGQPERYDVEEIRLGLQRRQSIHSQVVVCCTFFQGDGCPPILSLSHQPIANPIPYS
jgi:hypothetical protein